jgi:hypothetical protein
LASKTPDLLGQNRHSSATANLSPHWESLILAEVNHYTLREP